jgi:6-hydroxy-3-succinoylpyridine 3-monooxygenase
VEQLAASQLPRVIPGGKRPTSKPISWYANSERLLGILNLATTALAKRHAVFKWLGTPNPQYFPGKTPLELIEASDKGADAVEAYIRDYIQGATKTKEPDLAEASIV